MVTSAPPPPENHLTSNDKSKRPRTTKPAALSRVRPDGHGAPWCLQTLLSIYVILGSSVRCGGAESLSTRPRSTTNSCAITEYIYDDLLARILKQLYRRGPHLGIVVRVQKCRRIFSFDAKAAQPRSWLVSGPFWSGFRSGSGLGLWVGLDLRPYLDPTRTMQYVNSLSYLPTKDPW